MLSGTLISISGAGLEDHLETSLILACSVCSSSCLGRLFFLHLANLDLELAALVFEGVRLGEKLGFLRLPLSFALVNLVLLFFDKV